MDKTAWPDWIASLRILSSLCLRQDKPFLALQGWAGRFLKIATSAVLQLSMLFPHKECNQTPI